MNVRLVWIWNADCAWLVVVMVMHAVGILWRMRFEWSVFVVDAVLVCLWECCRVYRFDVDASLFVRRTLFV